MNVSLQEMVVLLLCVSVFGVTLLAYGQVFHKAGYCRLWALCMVIPLVNVCILIWFAFTKWPVEAELEEYRWGRSKQQLRQE